MEIAEMSNEKQVETFAELEKKLGKEITNMLRERTFYIKLFTNKTFYNTVVETMANELYTELA